MGYFTFKGTSFFIALIQPKILKHIADNLDHFEATQKTQDLGGGGFSAGQAWSQCSFSKLCLVLRRRGKFEGCYLVDNKTMFFPPPQVFQLCCLPSYPCVCFSASVFVFLPLSLSSSLCVSPPSPASVFVFLPLC